MIQSGMVVWLLIETLSRETVSIIDLLKKSGQVSGIVPVCCWYSIIQYQNKCLGLEKWTLAWSRPVPHEPVLAWLLPMSVYENFISHISS